MYLFKVSLFVFLAALGLHCFVQVLWLRRAGTAHHCCAWASRGLLVAVLPENTSSRCRARALATQVSVVAARGLTSCGSQALECRLHRSWHMGSAALGPVESSRTRE